MNTDKLADISTEEKVFIGLTQREIDAVQPGPCVVCGGTNYPLSMGGPSLCPACDTGASSNPQRCRKLRDLCEQQQKDGWPEK